MKRTFETQKKLQAVDAPNRGAVEQWSSGAVEQWMHRVMDRCLCFQHLRAEESIALPPGSMATPPVLDWYTMEDSLRLRIGEVTAGDGKRPLPPPPPELLRLDRGPLDALAVLGKHQVPPMQLTGRTWKCNAIVRLPGVTCRGYGTLCTVEEMYMTVAWVDRDLSIATECPRPHQLLHITATVPLASVRLSVHIG
jgi:hypothetical protein